MFYFPVNTYGFIPYDFFSCKQHHHQYVFTKFFIYV
jgi:hypothetical protein